MKATLKVGLSRKEGSPQYGSIGSCCELEVEIESVEELEAIKATIVGLQSLCDLATERGIKLQRRRLAQGPARDSAGAPGKPRQEWTSRQPAAANGTAPRPANGHGPGQGRGGYDGAPRNGKQLYPWLCRLEEQGHAGIKKAVELWGKDQGWGGRFQAWAPDEVRQAVAWATQQMSEGGSDV